MPRLQLAMAVRNFVCCLVMLLCVNYVSSCGVTTHNVIGQRARHWFASTAFPEYAPMLMKYPEAFQAGCAFPDWGYSCPFGSKSINLPAASEYSHWTPFQNQTALYIRQNFPKPWKPETEMFIAFLLGAVCHGVADTAWHDLGMPGLSHQGFIQALYTADYNGHGGDYNGIAHTEADTGGEFMAALEVDLSFLVTEWFVPSEHLANIFHAAGWPAIDAVLIDKCVSLLYAEVHAIRDLPSQDLYPYFADMAPFMTEQYQDWWMGGISDLASWTPQCWNFTVSWIEQGPSSQLCTAQAITPDEQAQLRHMKMEMDTRLHKRNLLASHLNRIETEIVAVPGGSVIRRLNPAAAAPTAVAPVAVRPAASGATVNCSTPETSLNASAVFYSGVAWTSLGYSLAAADFNGDGLDDIALGAPGAYAAGYPQQGAAYVVYGNNGISGHVQVDIDSAANFATTVLRGSASNERFGFATCAVDFNLDGLADLFVASPGINQYSLAYTGKVSGYFGARGGINSTASVVFSSADSYANLGMALKSGDVDGDGHADLLIAAYYAPGAQLETGEVWVFFSSTNRTENQTFQRADADLVLTPGGSVATQIFEWFGFHAEVALVNGRRLLLVGAPGYNDETSSVGMLYGFDVTQVTRGQALSPLFTIKGADEAGKFGFSFSVGNVQSQGPLLAVSTPARTVEPSYGLVIQAGGVYVLPLSQPLNGSYSMLNLTPSATINGDTEFGRLGWNVGWVDSNNDGNAEFFYETEPYGAGFNALRHHEWDTGAIYIWRTKNGPTNTDNSLKSCDFCIKSPIKEALFGRSVATLDFNGDGVMDLLLGGPRDSTSGAGDNTGSAALLLSLFQ
eukprot:TRINITY_DN1525_c0_g1_i2.p1 TRINITY_DN1525_c0_g1~~TRINITY_DN1525_c0_g1_i2.p1  ORF type:complete len:849 (-),score=281.79 TRINITY_DN1525_c0_g1_i2:324-2870(-)